MASYGYEPEYRTGRKDCQDPGRDVVVSWCFEDWGVRKGIGDAETNRSIGKEAQSMINYHRIKYTSKCEYWTFTTAGQN